MVKCSDCLKENCKYRNKEDCQVMVGYNEFISTTIDGCSNGFTNKDIQKYVNIMTK